METVAVVVQLKDVPTVDRTRFDIVEDIAKSAIELNESEIIKAIEQRTQFQTAAFIVEEVINQIIAMLYITKTADEMLSDITSGDLFAFRFIVQTVICEHPYIREALAFDALNS